MNLGFLPDLIMAEEHSTAAYLMNILSNHARALRVEQGRIHGIRCYETLFSAVKEKELRTYGQMYGPTDGRTDRPSYRGAS